MTTPTDREAVIQAALRRKRNASARRSRQRAAGLLEPLPRCACGVRCVTDRWLPLCSNCAAKRSLYPSQRAAMRRRSHRSRPLLVLADQVLDELRAEARAEQSVKDCNSLLLPR